MEDNTVKYTISFKNIFLAVVLILLALAVVTYNPADTAAIEGGTEDVGGITNAIGLTGAWAARFCFYYFGVATYPVLLLLLIGAVRAVFPRKYPRRWYVTGMALVTLACATLFALNPDFFIQQTSRLGIGHAQAANSALSGGVIGQWLAAPPSEFAREGILRGAIGIMGTLIVGWLVGLAGMVMVIFADWRDVGEYILSARPAQPPEEAEEPAPASREPSARSANLFQQAKLAEEAPERPEEEAVKSENRGGLLGIFKRKPRPEAPEEAEATSPSPVAAPEPPPREVQLPLAESGTRPPAQTEFPAWRKADAKPLTSLLGKRTPPSPAALEVPAGGASVKAGNLTFTINVDNTDITDTALPDAAAAEAPQKKSAPPPLNTDAEVIVPDDPDTESVNGKSVAPKVDRPYQIPQVFMLSSGANSAEEPVEEIAANKDALQDVMDSFKVDGMVSGHVWGPRVTRYDVTLSPGVDVGKVSRLADNIKMNLRATSIRILAPIPGEEAVGIEVPNAKPSAVFAREIMETEAWTKSDCDIPIVLGKNVSGKPVVMDLAKAPHLLIAGQTGSGKSVCMNTLIMSLLLKLDLRDLELILVDPKVVEHAPYRTLPQLKTPVINDAEKVPFALRWAVNQMESRYRILAAAGVKNLKEYNRKLAVTPMNNEFGDPLPNHLPYIIIIIDELADLMLTNARADVEINISRIAAKGRAAGIHIVVATQTPRKDIITGTIKANLPTRISFSVASQMDSRVILDKNGAETLLGKGDMLFMGPGGNLERIQGAWIKDEDIAKVVEFISAQAPQHFDSSVTASAENATEDETDDSIPSTPEDRDYKRITRVNASPMVQKFLKPGDDDLIAKALEIVLTEKKASTSSLQRKLKIGYNRAADLMDMLEERGVIGPEQSGGKQREVIVFDDLENQDY